MGVGSALLTPATLSIITDVFRDPRERARAIGIWSAFAGLGSGLGPVVGGILLAHFSWSSVFWVNVPVVVVGGVAAVAAGADQPGRDRAPASTRSARCCRSPARRCCSSPSSRRPTWGWTDRQILMGFAGSGVLIGSFLWWEHRNPTPMIDLSLFRNPRFSSANASLTIMFFVMFGQFFLLTQYLQFVRATRRSRRGCACCRGRWSRWCSAPCRRASPERLGNRTTLTGGLVVIAIGVALMGTFAPTPATGSSWCRCRCWRRASAWSWRRPPRR